MRQVLSSVACGGILELTFRIAKECGYAGVELLIPRGTEAKNIRRLQGKYHIPVVSIHGSPWTECGWRYWMSHGNSRRRLFAGFVQRFFGTVEKNPGIEVARDFNIPVVLHGGTVFELEQSGQLGLLEGVEVRVENCDTNLIDSTDFDGDIVADRAVQALERAGIDAYRCLDIEHLVRELIACGKIGEAFSGTSLLTRIERWLTNHRDSVRSFHLCDFLSMDQGHLPCGEGKLPLAKIARLFRQLDTERNDKNPSTPHFDFVAEPASKDWQTLLCYLARGGIGYRWALHNASSFTALFS